MLCSILDAKSLILASLLNSFNVGNVLVSFSIIDYGTLFNIVYTQAPRCCEFVVDLNRHVMSMLHDIVCFYIVHHQLLEKLL